ncbi:MAG: PEP-CTERM sorting domain-containing protein [Candidatus Auribacterota bacterium]
MKKWIGTLVFAVCLASGSGFALIVDGNLSDWGVTPGSDWNPDTGISSWVEDYVNYSNNGWVGPGYGGQPYDAEAIFAYIDDTDLYIALVVGMAPSGGSPIYSAGGSPNTSIHHFPGDLAFDLNGDGFYEYGIELTGYSGNSVSGQYYKHTYDAQKIGNIYNVLDGNGWNKGEAISQYTKTELNYKSPSSLQVIGNTTVAYVNSADKPDSYIIETVLPLPILELTSGIDWNIHWTMTCGNDIADLVIAGFSSNPPVAVPEPATILLLGIAVAVVVLNRNKTLIHTI